MILATYIPGFKKAVLLLVTIGSVCSQVAKCPNECFCSKGFTSVNCQGHGLVHVPTGIPKSTEKLYLDHNSLSAVNSSDFGILPNLRELHLDNNKIQSLEQGSFSGTSFPSLEQLLLKNNLITSIGRNSFENMASLEFLYLTNNYIKDIHKEAFTGTNSVKHIYLDSNKLSSIPGLGQLKQLADIYMSANGITDATFPKEYEHFVSLKHIGLSNNKITTLGNETFSALENSALTKLELNRNKISQIAPASFSYLTKLRSLYLGYNPLTAQYLENAIFGLQGKPLVSLNIVNVTLGGRLPSSTFRLLRNSSIKRLFLSNNNIRDIPSDSFTDIPQLLTLDLSGSKIMSVSDRAFHGLNSLMNLLLSDNELSEVPENLPKSLQNLYLNGNQITALKNNVFVGMSSLQTLYFGDNKIHMLEANAFNGLRNLKKLHLVKNIIGTLPGKIFQPLVLLESLELNRNSLTNIPDEPDVLSSMVSLQNLNLADNQLRTMPLEIFRNLKSLLYLHLERNRLGGLIADDKRCQLFSGLSKLQTLNLNSNGIEEIHDACLRDLVSVKEIHLKDNFISGWGPHLFAHTSELSTLDMSNNHIAMVKKVNVKDFNTLKLYNLSENPFACTCDLRWFRDWINYTHVKIANVTSYKCYSPKEWSGRPLLRFDRTKINCLWYTKTEVIIAFAVGASVTLILVVTLIIIIYRKRWYIRLRYYRMKKWTTVKIHRTKDYEPIKGRDYEYDAFIAYADEECRWVMQNILPKIDNGTLGTNEYGGKFKLYFDERDSVPGKSIFDNFVDNVESSRKVIIVLSRNYLKQGLCQFKLEHAVALKNEYRIEDYILVLIHGIRTNDIPKILKKDIQERNFIEWEDQEDAINAFREQLIKRLEEKQEII